MMELIFLSRYKTIVFYDYLQPSRIQRDVIVHLISLLEGCVNVHLLCFFDWKFSFPFISFSFQTLRDIFPLKMNSKVWLTMLTCVFPFCAFAFLSVSLPACFSCQPVSNNWLHALLVSWRFPCCCMFETTLSLSPSHDRCMTYSYIHKWEKHTANGFSPSFAHHKKMAKVTSSVVMGKRRREIHF